MAEAIPRAEWSEAEEYHERLFYWEYLVSTWLVPGPAFLKESTPDTPSTSVPGVPNMHDYGWLHERESLLEQ